MKSELVTIATFTDSFEAEMAKAFLEEAGFEVYLQNERFQSMYASMAGDMYTIQLQVFADAQEEANGLLNDLDDSYLANRILTNEKAIMEGHFLLTSGNHSNRYIEKIRLLQNPEATHTLCKRLAMRLEDYGFDTVIGPAFGAIILAYEVARILGKSFLFTHRKENEMTFRSGFDLQHTHKAVVIEDIASTGRSIREVINCATNQGIEVVAVGILVDRSGGMLDFGVPTESLLSLDIPMWSPDECELCKLGVDLVKPGSSDKQR
ncbi:MAG: orotate phosphoribosyltransferase [Candidatus Cloacimonetes bacterium]|jgi:orotate phosphoribosyltransferase|nr:orotate phosphoribosyltransferase [Candidatus Cloacimonadota bacterium]MDY0299730.1 orotate phosphoribosyltransferase [Candidatus Cloacimonadaceae bacterium]MCB5278806.1 orotate phosphoribosyltransferase [Candidatus Cloacimonadota bacterium]MCK9332996.1 orotate phosphoribosyltransferase [Candidatus Cloacimonadota bacterium]MDD2210199.1 orotate phosphoribosyltransferase [Candidatus Cloacimonadota bacterium]